MMTCPKCQMATRQVKDGLNPSGSQRYVCQECGRKYTPDPKPQGYDTSVRERAVALYLEGMNFRRIARLLSVNHQSVINWVNAHSAQIPNTPPVPAQHLNIVEMDEVYTFVGEKKTESIS